MPEAIFDVPLSADPENLNILLNKSIEGIKGTPITYIIGFHIGEWHKKRFEFLIGETFIRTTLEEFIEEYDIATVDLPVYYDLVYL